MNSPALPTAPPTTLATPETLSPTQEPTDLTPPQTLPATFLTPFHALPTTLPTLPDTDLVFFKYSSLDSVDPVSNLYCSYSASASFLLASRLRSLLKNSQSILATAGTPGTISNITVAPHTALAIPHKNSSNISV